MAELNIPDGLPSLSHGGHHPNTQHACIMELVSVIAGEDWTDQPATVHPTLRAAAIMVNDSLPDWYRHLLLPLVGRFLGTNTMAVSEVLKEYLDLPIPTTDPSAIAKAWGRLFAGQGGKVSGCGCLACRHADVERQTAEKMIDWLTEMLDAAETAMKRQPRELTEQDVARVRQVMHV